MNQQRLKDAVINSPKSILLRRRHRHRYSLLASTVPTAAVSSSRAPLKVEPNPRHGSWQKRDSAAGVLLCEIAYKTGDLMAWLRRRPSNLSRTIAVLLRIQEIEKEIDKQELPSLEFLIVIDAKIIAELKGENY